MKAILRYAISSMLIGGLSMTASAEIFTNADGKRVECVDQAVKTKDGHPVLAPLAGAVIGGVVGNQFGGGSGNKAATVVGAAGGAYAGKKYDDKRSGDGETTTQRVCRPID